MSEPDPELQGVTRDGDNFFRPWTYVPYYGPRPYLHPHMTEWIGPIPDADEPQEWALRYAQQYARAAPREGQFFLPQRVGEYVRLHRLAHGPAKKLSDWEQLPTGRPMLLSPLATEREIEKAQNRARYFQIRHIGRFSCTVDPAGALWVSRTR